ncbi:Ger(x)C family spore germination protein [Halalkalibacter kiskunsagensis]|uniref:Ger(X)C family spore germination protein n=1 Tax=Halalkalibacter kiskunsagensis TaxID=1548599 RepID=A0ABV6KHY7_9BACI
MNKQLIYSCVVLIYTLLLTGCLETSIVDEVSMVRAASFDLEEDGKLKLTVIFPTFPDKGQEQTLEQRIIEATGETTKGTKIWLNKNAQKPILFGQVRVLLFSQALAEQGLEKYIDAMYRNPAVGNRISLGIVEGNDAGALLDVDLGIGDSAGVFLPELIEQNQDTSTLPPTNMHEFLFSLYNDGRDSYLPLIVQSDNKVFVAGTALFSGDKFHSKLNFEDSFFMKLLLDTTRQGIHEFAIQDQEQTSYVVIEKLNSDFKRRVDKSGDVPLFIFDVMIDGAIEDYDGQMNLDETDTLNKIQQTIEKQISNRAQELLIQFRNEGIDPVGIGEKYRSTTRNWNAEKWKNELYPSAEFEVNVDLRIIQSGAVE